MKVGVPREVKDGEYRVALTLAGAHELVRHGHQVLVERGAGEGATLPDADFAAAGATVLPDADELWAESELVVKVKEPAPQEDQRLSQGRGLSGYRHPAAPPAGPPA